MKILAKSAVILSCVLASGLASATSIKIKDYHWGSLGTKDNFDQQVDKSPFDAFVHFTLGAGSIYDLTFNLSPTNATKWRENSSLAFELLSGDWGPKSDLDHAVVVGTKGHLNTDLVAQALAAGQYTLHVFGKGDTPQAKYYVEQIAIADTPVAAAPVASVSEPGSYALLVGGLGLMGFVARRRTKAKGA